MKLRPNYPEAWNNLGMIAAQKGNNEEAIRQFPTVPSVAALLCYRAAESWETFTGGQGNFEEAETLLKRAFDSEPKNPDVNYSLGMLYARRDQTEQAVEYLENAIKLRPATPTH